MAEEEFDIDIYGDAAADQREGKQDEEDYHGDSQNNGSGEAYDSYTEPGQDDMDEDQDHKGVSPNPPQQGVKRKEGSDDRAVDPGATSALLVSELNWWNTDDEIRGWTNQANCEDELIGITFSEHKVNGKSKGQAYLEFASQQAATATKHYIESSDGTSPAQKRATVIYSSPTTNPFKTLPKDAPARAAKDAQNRGPSGQPYNQSNNYSGNNFRGGYHNNRGNYNNRGGMNQGGYNRNFSGPNMNNFNFNNNNNNNGMGGGFGNMGGGGFGGGGGGGGGGFNRGGGFNSGFNRGGGMRGGRGGGGMNQGMMNMPMGGMPMGGMPMGGMPMMGGGMGGFQGMPGFNQGFFNGGVGGGNQSNDWQQNPHGQKRARGE
ncbi:hypothetical protein GQ53DRAFT_665453 [Thozetella sp. PMI_491]|nr:hypothetical protein GQ53DRAFT_665453 [Thozetella sp. PMI_491]